MAETGWMPRAKSPSTAPPTARVSSSTRSSTMLETYAKAGGSPAVSQAITAKLPDRPDLVKLGTFAGTYGYVMTGGTSANALAVYEAQAKFFTGYWGGTTDLDSAL